MGPWGRPQDRGGADQRSGILFSTNGREGARGGGSVGNVSTELCDRSRKMIDGH